MQQHNSTPNQIRFIHDSKKESFLITNKGKGILFASRFDKDNKKSGFQTYILKNLKLITNEKTITYHIQACYVLLYIVVRVSRGQCADHFLCEESDITPDDTSD